MKRCEYCGQLFETKILRKRFCCQKCRQKAYYISGLLEDDEEIKKIIEERRKEEAKEAYIFRDWSIKEKDCAEAWAFIKTIKPIDFKALFEAEKERLRSDMKKKKRARECFAEIE